MNKFNLDSIDNYLKDFVAVHCLEIERLTIEQTAEVIKQAILSGDIQRLVMQDSSAQSVRYIPFYDKQRLQHKIESQAETITKLREALVQARTILHEDYCVGERCCSPICMIVTGSLEQTKDVSAGG
jgi:meiotically up-regulated gene 157 (Mug157) protein